MKDRSRIGLAAAVVIAIALTGCSSNAGNGGGQGGTLRIGTSSGISSLNPFVGFNQDDYATWMYIYPTLVQYDTTKPNYDFVPNFAQSWELSKDGLKLDLPHPPNATWSDGQPLTADDVAWTFSMIMKFQHGPTGAWANSVQIEDDRGARRQHRRRRPTSGRPATALSDLGMTPILPQHVWEPVRHRRRQGAQDVSPTSPRTASRSSAAARSSSRSTRRTTSRCSSATRTSTGTQPHIDGFGLQFFRDEDAMVTALKTGQLDAIKRSRRRASSTLKAAGMQVYDGPGAARSATSSSTSNPNKPEHRGAAEPAGAGGVRVRDRPQRDRRDRLARVRAARLHVDPGGQRDRREQWHDAERPAAAVRHRQGEPDPRRARVRDGRRRDPGRRRPPDVLRR